LIRDEHVPSRAHEVPRTLEADARVSAGQESSGTWSVHGVVFFAGDWVHTDRVLRRRFDNAQGSDMKIDRTEFGSITISGKTYDHDVVICLSEEVVKRKKKLSKRMYGTSHIVSEDEARFVFEKGCKELIFGTGQYGNAALSPEAAAFLEKKGCRVIAEPTPEATRTFNRRDKPKIGLFHVTC
jgi:hypothetical protein